MVINSRDTAQASKPARSRWMALFTIPLLIVVFSNNVVVISGSMAIVAGMVAHSIIPEFSILLLAAGRTGADLNKPGRPVIAECLGIALGAVYLVTLFLFLPIPFLPWLSRRSTSNGHFPFEGLGNYTAALLSISCMLFLGFADDVLNLKWRHKVLLPAISSLPLLMIYAVTFGRTEVVVPLPLQAIFGNLLDLGSLYYVYMAMMTIFCTHSINILAGVNGVEVGQSVVIAISIIAHNALCILHGEEPAGHLLSLTLLLPFAAISLALLRHNWYPASVFVGDTFCYFAGMTFAVVGILGHFGKTLLFLFLPQIFNFVYSAPQLFGLLPCPRHRLPRLDERCGRLRPSLVRFRLTKRNAKLVRWLLRLRLLAMIPSQLDTCASLDDPQLMAQVSEKLRLGYLPAVDGSVTELTVNNLTLLNLLLVHFGPKREDHLAILLLGVQFATSALALFLRHYISIYFFP